MNIFNSLGSNYTFSFALAALFADNNTNHSTQLKSYLEDTYQGKVILLYKGREAIELALKLANLPSGSLVAINGFTCYAVYKAVANTGLGVECLDIEGLDLNFSAQQLKNALKKQPKIKAVIIQNTLGDSCEIEAIAKTCKENKVILIEDLAHSAGPASHGDFAVLSFSQDKMIDAVSGGALIITNKLYQDIEGVSWQTITAKQQLVDRFYPLLTYLIRSTYSFGLGKLIHLVLKNFGLLSQPMSNLKTKSLHILPNWYCKLVLLSFKSFETDLKHRQLIADIYSQTINPKLLSGIVSTLRFAIFTEQRNSLIKFLKESGVYVSDIWYDAPIAPAKFMHLTNYQHQCPQSEKVSNQIINLPTHKNISLEQAKKVAERINQWQQSH